MFFHHSEQIHSKFNMYALLGWIWSVFPYYSKYETRILKTIQDFLKFEFFYVSKEASFFIFNFLFNFGLNKVHISWQAEILFIPIRTFTQFTHGSIHILILFLMFMKYHKILYIVTSFRPYHFLPLNLQAVVLHSKWMLIFLRELKGIWIQSF